MTWPGIELWFPGPLVNTLLIRPTARLFSICYVISYLHLVGTTEIWEILVVSESGARLILQRLLPSSISIPQLLNAEANHQLCHFSAKTVFTYLFLLFSSRRVSSTAFSLINLPQLILFTVGLCHSNNESLSLPPEEEICCVLQWGADSLPPTIMRALCALLSAGGGLLSSRDSYAISFRSLT